MLHGSWGALTKVKHDDSRRGSSFFVIEEIVVSNEIRPKTWWVLHSQRDSFTSSLAAIPRFHHIDIAVHGHGHD